MTNINVKELRNICDRLIKDGKGNMKVLVSDDDELNGVHCLWGYCNDGQDFEDMVRNANEYVVLS